MQGSNGELRPTPPIFRLQVSPRPIFCLHVPTYILRSSINCTSRWNHSHIDWWLIRAPPDSLAGLTALLLKQRRGKEGGEEKGTVPHLLSSILILAGCPSCHQPVLKTFTGPHPSFNHQRTSEGRDVAPFYAWSQKSVAMGYVATMTNETRQTSFNFTDAMYSVWWWFTGVLRQQSIVGKS